MKRIFFILLSVSILLVACNKEDNSNVADSSINGLLVAENDDVISDALVSLYQDDEVISQSMSDSLGKFTFRNVVAGTYKIGAFSEKYKNSPLLDYEVKENTVHDLTFVFNAKVSVSGILLDKFNNPFKKISIYIKPQSEKKSATVTEETKTDDLGNFSFYGIESGIYKLFYNTSYGSQVSQLVNIGENSGSTTILLISTEAAYETFVDDRDKRVYRTVKIGNQVWMAENLAYLPKVDTVTNTSTSESRYYVYNYAPIKGITDAQKIANAKLTSSFVTYGVLYNGTAVLNGEAASTSNPSGVRGIAPAGWHIPSDAEWIQLRDYATANYTLSGAGMSLRANSPLWAPTYNGNDWYSFRSIPGGYVDQGGSYQAITDQADFYSASLNYFELSYGTTSLRGPLTLSSRFGFSIRCVKN